MKRPTLTACLLALSPLLFGFEPLRSWFAALYEVLLGQSQGPRFGSFAALFGCAQTAAMIRSALAGNFLK